MQNGIRPPEWWTGENTKAWEREVWGDPDGWSQAQRGWAPGYTDYVPRGKAIPPIPPATLATWRAQDSRPSNTTYFDGTPILSYRPLSVKRGRKVKA